MDEKLREQWESNAEAFSGLIDGAGTPHHRKILNPCVERLLGEVKGKKLLDAGCGEGYLARYYAKKGADVTAIDLSQRLIETSEQLTDSEGVTIDYRVDNVCYIESVPNVPPGIRGDVGLTADIEAGGLEDIRIHLSAVSPGIFYEVDEAEERTPALKLSSEMVLGVDSRFQVWTLDSTSVQLNDIVSGKLTGRYVTSEQGFHFALRNGEIRNDKIFDFLPADTRKQLEGMRVLGRETIAANVDGKLIGDSVMISMDGELRFVGVGMEDSVNFMRLEGVEGEMGFKGDLGSVEASAEIVVGKIFLEKMRSEPVVGSRLNFDLRMVVGDSLWIDR